MGAKIKVVFDTNVWVTIFLKKAVSREFSEILKEGNAEVYVTKALLEEISKVLMYPKLTKLLETAEVSPREIFKRIVENSVLVNPQLKLHVVKEDPEDNKILDCAVKAQADFIISGDRHLLKLKKFRNIRIVTPRDFLDLNQAGFS